MGNKNLRKAKKNKNDEFYTQLTDIEKELRHYKKQLRGKVVFCNCDDPEYSNFWKYFKLNFHHLGLRRLITTHYDEKEPTYKLEYNGVNIIKTNLQQNGDFRSPEAVEILEQSDVVITNPPFSLFREYVAQLIEYEKQFLIIGNHNAITYKEVFPLFKENKIWLGYSPRSMEFLTPEGELKSVNACWFTNLDVKKRHEKLILYKKYTPEKYPKYVNYDAINVDRVNEIPCDYYGAMGVPLTFVDKYNPEQFEILGISSRLGKPMDEYANKGEYVSGGPAFYLKMKNKKYLYKRLYTRILIKRKEQEGLSPYNCVKRQ